MISMERDLLRSASTHFLRLARSSVSPRSWPRSAWRKVGAVGSSRWKRAEVDGQLATSEEQIEHVAAPSSISVASLRARSCHAMA
jgi:hypothetical protein